MYNCPSLRCKYMYTILTRNILWLLSSVVGLHSRRSGLGLLQVADFSSFFVLECLFYFSCLLFILGWFLRASAHPRTVVGCGSHFRIIAPGSGLQLFPPQKVAMSSPTFSRIPPSQIGGAIVCLKSFIWFMDISNYLLVDYKCLRGHFNPCPHFSCHTSCLVGLSETLVEVLVPIGICFLSYSTRSICCMFDHSNVVEHACWTPWDVLGVYAGN